LMEKGGRGCPEPEAPLPEPACCPFAWNLENLRDLSIWGCQRENHMPTRLGVLLGADPGAWRFHAFAPRRGFFWTLRPNCPNCPRLIVAEVPFLSIRDWGEEVSPIAIEDAQRSTFRV